MQTSLGFIVLLGSVLSIFASSILLYISIATMLGPWIAPMLMLISAIVLALFRPKSTQRTQELVMVSALASGGGIIAVGVGFSFPMLHFLAPQEFQALMQSPCSFIIKIGIAIALAGAFGIFIGKFFSQLLLKKEDLSFPISHLSYQIAAAQSHATETRGLSYSIIITSVLCILRDGLLFIKSCIPKNITLLHAPFSGGIIFSVWPTLWAIGFTTGLASTLPLLLGLIARHFVLYPINHHSIFLPWHLFTPVKEEAFITAFCSGMILADIILGCLQNPQQIFYYIKNYISHLRRPKTAFFYCLIHPIQTLINHTMPLKTIVKSLNKAEPILGLTSFFLFFSYLEFNPLAQLMILATMCISLYEINRLCGKIGLLNMGRFSVFVLVPIVVIFKINPLQMTALTLFFNVAAAVSSDLLFDYKTADLSSTSRDKVHGLQWLGLFISSVAIGVACYLLFTTLTIGSDDFFAHRGRTKALLLQSLDFNHFIVIAGFVFGWILRKFRVSPTMAFGGIIMPSQITLGFVFGGLLSKIAGKHRDKYLLFCSGVFATEALWLFIGLSLRFFTQTP